MSEKCRALSRSLGDLDLRLLRVFRVVVECGGFTSAEAALGTGKSTISKHIADLEQRLRLRLCRRGRSGFALTEEGLLVFRATLRLFASIEDFKLQVNDVHSGLIGTLSLGFVDTILTDAGSPLLAAITSFREKAPDVHLRLSVGATTEIERGVLDATLHAGIVVERSSLPGLTYKILYTEKSLLYCSVKHPLFPKPDEQISPADLAKCSFVQRSYSEDEYTTALKATFRPSATADHSEAIAMLVLSGHFIGFLPEHYASLWVARGEMRPLAQLRAHYYTRLATVTRTGASRSTALDRFLSEVAVARRYSFRGERER